MGKKTANLSRVVIFKMAGLDGFEPSILESKPADQFLEDICSIIFSK
ncbi:hypothetical protein RI065_04365 [Mycoplasmatota bacterium zrk1]